MTRESEKVLFVDDNEDLRDLMRLLLKTTLKVECLCFGSVRELENHSSEALSAKVAILDINLGSNVPGGIDAFNWLKDHGFHGRILFLTGHARTNPQVKAAEIDGAKVLEKPLQPDKLISIVTQALNET
jgi:DNA-binding NtrC family response regulator